MSQQKEMSFKEFRQRFQTEEVCEAYLFEQRWLDGFVCPNCRGTGCSRLRGCQEYVCKHCHWQSSVTMGTVLHRIHLPLTIWFWAIYLAARDKRDISAIQLSRELEIAYRSAWCLLHRLCIVELDDAYFGAPRSNRKRDRGTEKTIALATVSLELQSRFWWINTTTFIFQATSRQDIKLKKVIMKFAWKKP